LGQIFSSLGISPSLLISQIVNFVLMSVLLYVLLYRPILNFLHKRQERIARSMADADAARENAAKAQEEYDKRMGEAQRKGQEIIAQAVQTAEQRRVEIEAEAGKHAEEIRERARADAEQERERILAEVQSQIAGLSMLATERVLGQAVAPDRDLQHKLIEQFLNELGSGGRATPGGAKAVRDVA
jgi:F-type H+-transporting ATPase subunit b